MKKPVAWALNAFRISWDMTVMVKKVRVHLWHVPMPCHIAIRQTIPSLTGLAKRLPSRAINWTL